MTKHPIKKKGTEDNAERLRLAIGQIVSAATEIEAEIKRSKATLTDRGRGIRMGVNAILTSFTQPMKPGVSIAQGISDASDADVLRQLIAQSGLPQNEVAKGTDISESTLSVILAGTRILTRWHICALCSFFNVSPSAFPPIEKRRKKKKR